MILDNRIHRTIPITTDPTNPVNLVADTEKYTVSLQVTGDQDVLVIKSKDGSPVPPPIPLIRSFAPPHCSSPVGRYDNSDCQWALKIDEKLLRVIETHVNLMDPVVAGDQVIVYDSASADAKPIRGHKLYIQYNTFAVSLTAAAFGIKVPPDLG